MGECAGLPSLPPAMAKSFGVLVEDFLAPFGRGSEPAARWARINADTVAQRASAPPFVFRVRCQGLLSARVKHILISNP